VNERRTYVAGRHMPSSNAIQVGDNARRTEAELGSRALLAAIHRLLEREKRR